MSAFLYLARAEVGDLRIAKVGTSKEPRARVRAIFSASPLSLVSCLFKEFPGRGEAAAWEKHLICSANRYKGGGEWVLDDELLADLWAGVTGGTDVDFDYRIAGRFIPQDSNASTRRQAFAQRFRDRVGPVCASQVNYDGHPTLFNRAIITARLIQGMGVDDISVLDEIHPEEIRREIARFRSKGLLASIYSSQKASA